MLGGDRVKVGALENQLSSRERGEGENQALWIKVDTH